MRICLSEATTMPASFVEDVDACAAAGCDAIEVWLTKLEKHIAEHSAGETRQWLTDRGVTPVAASYQGGLLLSKARREKPITSTFANGSELCQTLGIGTMLVVADFTTRQSIPLILEPRDCVLAQAAQWAAGFGVRLALEFSRLGHLLLQSGYGGPSRRVLWRAKRRSESRCFSFFQGAQQGSRSRALPDKNLAFVQICDLAGVPRELATDADRILPAMRSALGRPTEEAQVSRIRRTRFAGADESDALANEAVASDGDRDGGDATPLDLIF